MIYAFRTPLALIAVQVSVVAGGMIALAFQAPAAGRLWIVPLDESSIGGLSARAVEGGAVLLGVGPTAGSLIVIGNRDRISRALADRNVMTLAAPPAECGGIIAP